MQKQLKPFDGSRETTKGKEAGSNRDTEIRVRISYGTFAGATKN